MRGFTNRLLLMFLVLCTAVSCHRRPLFDLEYTHYVRVYIDEELNTPRVSMQYPADKDISSGLLLPLYLICAFAAYSPP